MNLDNKRGRELLEREAVKLRERARQHNQNPVGYGGGGHPSSLRVKVDINKRRGIVTLVSREEAESLGGDVVDGTPAIKSLMDKFGAETLRAIVRDRDDLRTIYRETVGGRAMFVDETIPAEVARTFAGVLSEHETKHNV